MGKNLVLKYKKLAQKATFTNKFIESCLNADENKSLYDNHLSSGSYIEGGGIEGKCIRVKTIEKYCGKKVIEEFFNALRKGERWSSHRFNIYGYDGSLHTWAGMGYFDKEYRDCGNGYYYLLINDENFIGYDID